jgi:hypothetical protein
MHGARDVDGLPDHDYDHSPSEHDPAPLDHCPTDICSTHDRAAHHGTTANILTEPQASA